MHVLVLNPGSSTLKYRLVEVVGDEARAIDSGIRDHVAGDALAEAAAEVVQHCRPAGIDAVGCRVVHGGEHFAEPTLVTADVLGTIRDLGRLAPLHNPPAAAVLDRVAKTLPEVPIVAVFDTAFHRTLPNIAALYAIPLDLARQKGLRRYGFHGTSHQYVAGRLRELTGRQRLVTCHLGNGASITAVRDGRSVDTSMGLTPLEGLMMGTRSGDIDAGLVLHLLREEKMSVEEVDRLLNQQSGLLGVGGHADLRELESSKEERAQVAMELFAYRVRKYIGAYAAVLGGVEAIAFTGGIGEHSSQMRARICDPLFWMFLRLAPLANANPPAGDARISAEDSQVQVWVIPTDEEALIARATAEVVGRK